MHRGCRLQPTGLQASVWQYRMVFPNEVILGACISIPLTSSPHRKTPPPMLIRNSLHIVGPLCKRKSPWIIEAVSFCFSQSSVHCEKLISQAEALQKDLSKREVIVQSPLLGFDFFLTPIISQVHIQVRRDCKASNLPPTFHVIFF